MSNKENIAASMYRLFQQHPEGIKVFEYLASRFYDQPLYSRGDAYDSIYNIAQRDVIHHIINMMTQAQQEPKEDEHAEI